jgi:hypothetical protein
MFEPALTSNLSAVHQYLQADRINLKFYQQKKTELDFMHLVSKIHSELDMIQSVPNQLEKVMDKSLLDAEEERNLPCGVDSYRNAMTSSWETVTGARELLDTYTAWIDKIHKDTDHVEKTIYSFLGLQCAYTNLEDTQNSTLVSLAALAFAIMTVIFTPLSFMTSLFALPIQEILKHQQATGSPDIPSQAFDSKYVGGHIGTFSLLEITVRFILTLSALGGFATWTPTGTLLVVLYLRWTGHFGRQGRQDEPKKDTATEGCNADKKKNDHTSVKPRVPLQEGLRRRWNVLVRRQKNGQAQEGDTDADMGNEGSAKKNASKSTPQILKLGADKSRKNVISIV